MLTEKKDIFKNLKIHPTAIIEDNVSLGEGTSVWDNVHIRRDTTIGGNCIVGEKTYIAYGVQIGNGVKINSFVYICNGVTVEDQVMISAGTVFTNDVLPRAFDVDGKSVKTSDPTEETLETSVGQGATIGANCTIGPGIQIGEYAMIGMGSVVTRDVAPYHLVYGNPARSCGLVCICGSILFKFDPAPPKDSQKLNCTRCSRKYEYEAKGARLIRLLVKK
jgi:acetyltransferase-like isoleucine patch superfamily enzyme